MQPYLVKKRRVTMELVYKRKIHAVQRKRLEWADRYWKLCIARLLEAARLQTDRHLLKPVIWPTRLQIISRRGISLHYWSPGTYQKLYSSHHSTSCTRAYSSSASPKVRAAGPQGAAMLFRRALIVYLQYCPQIGSWQGSCGGGTDGLEHSTTISVLTTAFAWVLQHRRYTNVHSQLFWHV
jgi:hypothetical protein